MPIYKARRGTKIHLFKIQKIKSTFTLKKSKGIKDLMQLLELRSVFIVPWLLRQALQSLVSHPFSFLSNIL